MKTPVKAGEKMPSASAVGPGVMRCAACIHWKKLVDTNESYGTCDLKLEDLFIPTWAYRVLKRHGNNFGSLHPDGGKDCGIFKPKNT